MHLLSNPTTVTWFLGLTRAYSLCKLYYVRDSFFRTYDDSRIGDGRERNWRFCTFFSCFIVYWPPLSHDVIQLMSCVRVSYLQTQSEVLGVYALACGGFILESIARPTNTTHHWVMLWSLVRSFPLNIGAKPTFLVSTHVIQNPMQISHGIVIKHSFQMRNLK